MFLLSLIGIPIGLVVGYGLGALLLPVILKNWEYSEEELTIVQSVHPAIFILTVFFVLLTVFLSMRRPSKKAAKYSAIETAKYILPGNLSGGQQQRVAIARALITKPAIILADEPTGNLDTQSSLEVMGLLKQTSQRFCQTIVMITHNMNLAQMADRIIRIQDGKIIDA